MREPPTGTIFRAAGCGFGNAELSGNLSASHNSIAQEFVFVLQLSNFLSKIPTIGSLSVPVNGNL